jgi:hypothetical protein
MGRVPGPLSLALGSLLLAGASPGHAARPCESDLPPGDTERR